MFGFHASGIGEAFLQNLPKLTFTPIALRYISATIAIDLFHFTRS